MTGKLKPYEPLLMTLLRFNDALCGVIFFLSISHLYKVYEPNYLVASIIIFLTILICFNSFGIYRSWRTIFVLHEIHHIILGCITIYLILLIFGYSLKASAIFSRRVFFTWAIIWPLFLSIERFCIRLALGYFRKKGYNFKRAVIAGSGNIANKLTDWLNENPWSGTKIISFFNENDELDNLPNYIKNNQIDVVYIAFYHYDNQKKIEWLLKELSDSTVSIYLIPDIFILDLFTEGNIFYFDNIPVISLHDSPIRGLNRLMKRMEDILISSIVLLFLSVVMLIIAFTIKLTSKGPILFKQWRYGIGGKPIKIYKFRTMTVWEDGYTFNRVTKDDPRVTKLGAFLRKTSLDELPQFINVLQGRMSIVGPRPHPVAMNEAYRQIIPGYMLRHKIKPGITGLAQVMGFRGEIDNIEKMQKRISYDLEYIRQWSILLDLKIILKTIWLLYVIPFFK
ncbi:MAG: undecaprenyl-phosphate glucose phosphotransferase [Desulfobacterales bacterium]|nr:undecaprenyl-phosphate glucose phosphotransferase [Desulfobacterales bacterium]